MSKVPLFFVFASFLLGTLAEKEAEVPYSPATHPELVFSRCDLAEKIADWKLEHLAPVAHPGFWTCAAMYNSANYAESDGFIAHRCGRRSPEDGGVRCADDLYGIFNFQSKYFCTHRYPRVGDVPNTVNVCKGMYCDALIDADLTNTFKCLNYTMHDYSRKPLTVFAEATKQCCSSERYYRVLPPNCSERVRSLSRQEPYFCRNVTQSMRMKKYPNDNAYYFGDQPGPPPMVMGRLDVDAVLEDKELKDESGLHHDEFNIDSRPSERQLKRLASFEGRQIVAYVAEHMVPFIKEVLGKRAQEIHDPYSSDLKAILDDITEDILDTFVAMHSESQEFLQNYALAFVKAYIVQARDKGTLMEGPIIKLPPIKRSTEGPASTQKNGKEKEL